MLAELQVALAVQGTPEAPRCGFSSRVVDALRVAGVEFGIFDILNDDAVREGLKALSDWPTYPQVRTQCGRDPYTLSQTPRALSNWPSNL